MDEEKRESSDRWRVLESHPRSDSVLPIYLIGPILLLCFLCCGLHGCGGGEDAESKTTKTQAHIPLTQDQVSGEPVATLKFSGGQVHIGLDRLLAYAEEHPDQSIERSLQDLVEFEILVQEAHAAGFSDDPEVEYKRNQVMVRRYLKHGFESEWTEDTVPENFIRAAYERYKNTYVHPELREVDHIVVAEMAESSSGALKPRRPVGADLDAQARVLAQQIYDDMGTRTPTGRNAFMARAKEYADMAEPMGLRVWAERLKPFALVGAYSKDFTEKVFEHDTPQTVIPPFATSFGYHVVWIEDVKAPKNESFSEAEADIRRRLLPDFLEFKLRDMVDEMANKYPAIAPGKGVKKLLNPAPLGAFTVHESQSHSRGNTR